MLLVCYESISLAAAEKIVGHGGRVQPDWFQETSEILIPIM